MKLRTRLAGLLLILTVLTAAATGFAQTPKHKVLFALTSGDQTDWNLTLGNIHNLLKSFNGEPAEVELVAYGPGLAFVRQGSTAASGIADLETLHVHFFACENSMRAQHLTRADLLPGVGTVPSGVAEVVSKQEQGWAYVKAGR